MTTQLTILKSQTTWRKYRGIMAMVLAVVGMQSQALAVGQWDAVSLERLKAGEVVVETLHKDQPGGAARVSAIFYGDSAALWEVIGDCRYEMIYIRGLLDCEVLQSDNSHMVVHHRMHISRCAPILDFSFTADRTEDGKGVANLVDGNLKVLESSWEVIPLEGSDASIVSHEIRIQPDFLAPGGLIRRSLSRDLPDMLACIRGLANASADQQSVLADLQRCPGDVTALLK